MSRRHSALSTAALAIVLALAFLGSRGIWDPDEGRYTNVALNMLESGDWLVPMRNEDVAHWTKPPLTYWAIAASVAAFGQSPFAARLPIALSFLACVWLVWRSARRLVPGSEPTAATAFATMLLPFAASQFVTTDFLLTALETLAVAAYVEARFGPPPSARWVATMWCAFALAFMTKGPPGLVPLLAIVVFERLVPGDERRTPLAWWGPLVFAAFALPWFAAVIARDPALLDHFIGDEVVDRLGTDRFGRNGQWYGWIVVYVPVLLAGTLPWTASLWRWGKSARARLHGWREAAGRRADAPTLLLSLWVVLPLVVFCLARSRLPLYVLPLFVPLALLVAAQRGVEGRPLPSVARLASWAAVLLGIKLVAANWPTHKDASIWADAIRARVPGGVHEVVFAEDMARYGLRLHLDVEVEKISVAPLTAQGFDPEFDEALATELRESASEIEDGVVFVTREAAFPALQQRIRDAGLDIEAMGAPFEGRIIGRLSNPRSMARPGSAPASAPATLVPGTSVPLAKVDRDQRQDCGDVRATPTQPQRATSEKACLEPP